MWCVSCSVVSNSMRPYGLKPTRLLCPWDSPGKNTGVGCCAIFQGIFLTQGSNLYHLGLTCTGRQVLYHWATREAARPLHRQRRNILERDLLRPGDNGGVYFIHGSEIQYYKDINFPQTDLHIVDTVSI